MSHSFIQNLCRITASFTASRMNSWTLITSLILLKLTILPSLRPISSKQTVSSNQYFCCLNLSWSKTKLQNVGAGDPPSTILIVGVEEFILSVSRWQLPTGCSTQDWTCLFIDEFSTEGMKLQLYQYQYQSTPVPSTDKVSVLL